MICNTIISGNNFADIYILYSGSIISLLSFRQAEIARIMKKYDDIGDVFALSVSVYVCWSRLMWQSVFRTDKTL